MILDESYIDKECYDIQDISFNDIVVFDNVFDDEVLNKINHITKFETNWSLSQISCNPEYFIKYFGIQEPFWTGNVNESLAKMIAHTYCEKSGKNFDTMICSRIYLNGQTSHQTGYLYNDCGYELLYYPGMYHEPLEDWHPNYGGELMFFGWNGNDYVPGPIVTPKKNRMVFFPKRLNHKISAPSSCYYGVRASYALRINFIENISEA